MEWQKYIFFFMNCNGNTAFFDLESRWKKNIISTGDIQWSFHLDFFRELVDGIVSWRIRIPDARYYAQKNAGFFRMRILECIDSSGTEYKVSFHSFRPSVTAIHAHWYSWNSWLIQWWLEYYNFGLEKLSDRQQSILSDILNLIPVEKRRRVSQELYEMQLWILDTQPSFSTQTVAAMLWWAGIFSDVEMAKYYDNIEATGQDFGVFAQAQDIQWIVMHSGYWYRLIPKVGWKIAPGETYMIGENLAHAVVVPESASTLFITRKRKDQNWYIPEWEYHLAPPQVQSEIISRLSPKAMIYETLKAIKNQDLI